MELVPNILVVTASEPELSIAPPLVTAELPMKSVFATASDPQFEIAPPLADTLFLLNMVSVTMRLCSVLGDKGIKGTQIPPPWVPTLLSNVQFVTEQCTEMNIIAPPQFAQSASGTTPQAGL
jgi:hypothetical protein